MGTSSRLLATTAATPALAFGGVMAAGSPQPEHVGLGLSEVDGALQGDPQGFPNGRRLGDDVVDIELRVIGGALFNLVGAR